MSLKFKGKKTFVQEWINQKYSQEEGDDGKAGTCQFEMNKYQHHFLLAVPKYFETNVSRGRVRHFLQGVEP
jgi:hypothetical protein